MAASHLISFRYGYRWTAAGERSQFRPCGVANRVDRQQPDFLETLPFFLPLVSVAQVTHRHSLLTFWGAPVILGTPRIFACRGDRICSVAFACCPNTALIGIAFFVHRTFSVDVVDENYSLGEH